MSKIAILSDTHGNLHALQAVMEELDAEGIEKVFFGGDLIGYAAKPAACVELAMTRGAGSVIGNHEEIMFRYCMSDDLDPVGAWRQNEVLAALVLAARQLDASQLAWLENLPDCLDLGGAMLAHAELEDFRRWDYIDSPSNALPSLAVLKHREGDCGFVGHTHIQRIFPDPDDERQPEPLGERRFHIPEGLATVVTVGSVGQPREPDFDVRAGWATWDQTQRIVEFRRTEYDIEAAVAAIREAKLPDRSGIRLLGRR